MFKALFVSTLLTSVVLGALPVAAETTVKTGRVQPLKADIQALSAEQSLKNRLRFITSFEASFKQQVTDGTGELVQTSEGKLYLQQPNKLRWHVEDDDTLLIADGRSVFQIDPFVESVSAYDQSATIDNNPMVLLTDPEGEQWQDFTVDEINNQYLITSKSADSQIKSLALEFSAERLSKITIVDAQQQNSEIVFSEIQQNHKLAPSLFELIVPEEFDFDDQRQLLQN